MKKLMFMAMVATIAVVACEKDVGVEDEGSTGTRAYSDSTEATGGITFYADTAWTDTIFVDF